jgi:hypothetical protein
MTSAAATHITTAALLLLAVASTIMHLMHRRLRERVLLAYEPGTIVSAVTIGADTELANLLSRPMGDPNAELMDKRFRFDVTTGKIVVDHQEKAAQPV